MINRYSLELLEAYNSIEEDFAIWECKMMVLEHNLIVQEASIKQVVKKGIDAASQRANESIAKNADGIFDKEQKVNKIKNGINTITSKANIIKSSKEKLLKLFKDIYAKFIGIFKKFKSVAIQLVKKDEAWLKQYKNTILNTDLSKLKYEHEIFAYWIGLSHFNKLTPRPLNRNDKAQMKALESVDTFREYLINKHIPTKANLFKKNDNFIANLKNVFRGENVTKLKAMQLQDMLKGMIDYCENYSNIDKELRKDLDNITNACKEAEREAKKINPSNVNIDPNNDKANMQEAFSLFFEATDSASNKDITRNNKENMEKAKENIDKVKANSNNVENPHTQQIQKITSQTSPEIALKELQKYKIYLNVCSTIVSTKLEIAEEKYHAYMGLLKAVVNLGLYQSKETQEKGMSYNNRTDQIENSKASKLLKKTKQNERNAMR